MSHLCFTFKQKKQSPRRLLSKGVLRNFAKFTGKHLCQSLFLSLNFIKKETLAQVFSCEFSEISKNTFFYRTPLVAASVNFLTKYLYSLKNQLKENAETSISSQW